MQIGQGLEAASPFQESLMSALEPLQDQRWAEAKARLLDVIATNPRTPMALLAMASACKGLGELDKALLALAHALDLDASRAPAYFLLGEILEGLAQPELAVRAHATALQLDPDHEAAAAARLRLMRDVAATPLGEVGLAMIERLLALIRPTVAACIVVTGDPAFLPPCVASLEGWVDEIIVVAVGVAVADLPGIQVLALDAATDAGTAHNAALARAQSDWFLVIGVDEVFAVADRADWLSALRRREPAAYALGHADGLPAIRLMQRLPAITFAGPLYASPDAALLALAWPTWPLPTASFGWSAAPGPHDPTRVSRKLAWIVAHGDRYADDPLACHDMAFAFAAAGSDDEARAAFERLSTMREGWAALPDVAFVKAILEASRLAAAGGDRPRAMALLDQGVARLANQPDMRYARGCLRREAGDEGGARVDFAHAMASPRCAPGVVINPRTAFDLPDAALAKRLPPDPPWLPSLPPPTLPGRADKLARPIADPGFIAILLATRARPESLRRFFGSIRETASDLTRLDVWLYVDEDDDVSRTFLETDKAATAGVTFHVVYGPPTVAQGTTYNVLRTRCTSAPGVYMVASDKITFPIVGWDASVRTAFAAYPDGLLFAHPSDTFNRDGVFGAFGFLGAAWTNVVGRLFSDYFPFWYDETWINAVAEAIGRRVVLDWTIALETDPPARLSNLMFWSRFYNATSDQRLADVRDLLRAIHGRGPALDARFLAARSSLRDGDTRDMKPLDPAVIRFERAMATGLRSATPRPVPGTRAYAAEAAVLGYLAAHRATALAAGQLARVAAFDEMLAHATEAADDLVGRIRAAMAVGDPARTSHLLAQLVTHFPNFPDYFVLRAAVEVAAGRPAMAREVLRDGLCICPADPGLLAAAAALA